MVIFIGPTSLKTHAPRIPRYSSADTELAERIGRATLKLLEVVPGTTVWDLVVKRDWDGEDVNQIGRRPPLSANKSSTHFPILRELTRIRYDRQLFFDDCQVRGDARRGFLRMTLLGSLLTMPRDKLSRSGVTTAGRSRGPARRLRLAGAS